MLFSPAMPRDQMGETREALKYTRMCKYWQHNRCNLGYNCTFAHDASELRWGRAESSRHPCLLSLRVESVESAGAGSPLQKDPTKHTSMRHDPKNQLRLYESISLSLSPRRWLRRSLQGAARPRGHRALHPVQTKRILQLGGSVGFRGLGQSFERFFGALLEVLVQGFELITPTNKRLFSFCCKWAG